MCFAATEYTQSPGSSFATSRLYPVLHYTHYFWQEEQLLMTVLCSVQIDMATCDTSLHRENGTVRYTSEYVGGVFNLQCHTGYSVEGHASSSCNGYNSTDVVLGNCTGKVIAHHYSIIPGNNNCSAMRNGGNGPD